MWFTNFKLIINTSTANNNNNDFNSSTTKVAIHINNVKQVYLMRIGEVLLLHNKFSLNYSPTASDISD